MRIADPLTERQLPLFMLDFFKRLFPTEAPLPANVRESRPPAPVAKPTAPLPPEKVRILVAEDNAVSQQFTMANLRKLGYDADVAANGVEVLTALKIKRYDVILMDCEMPKLDGYDATKEIRQREQNGSHLWIIAMTAYAVVGDREKCLKAGMDDYISKPLRPEELRTALERGTTRTVGS